MKIDKAILYFGVVFFILSLLSAIYFYLERNMGDTGWRIYYILNTIKPCPSHKRWILVLNQIPALLAVCAKLPLKFVLILHSIGNVLVFSFMFGLTYTSFKNKYLSLSIILSYVLGIGAIYFTFPDLEKHLAAPFLIFLGFHLSFSKLSNWKHILVSIPIFFFLSLSNPIVFLPLTMIILIYLFESKTRFKYFYVVLFLLALLLKVKASDQYESTKFIQLFSIQELQTKIPLFLIMLKGRTLFFIFSSILIFLLYQNKRKKLLIFYIFCFIFYLTIVLFLVPSAHQFPYLIPFTAFNIYLFFKEFNFESLNKKQLQFWTLFFISILSLETYQILLNKKIYIKSINFYSSVIDIAIKNNKQKIVVDKLPIGTSAYPIAESAIISSLNHKKTVVIVDLAKSEERVNAMKSYYNNLKLYPIKDKTNKALNSIEYLYNENYLYNEQKMWFLNEMNPVYFNIGNNKFLFYENIVN